jgi:hypothetical protein
MPGEDTGAMTGTDKFCRRCDRYLPFAAFRRSLYLKSGLDSQCRECHTASNRAWRASHPEYRDAYNLARRVGPTPVVCTECGVEFLGRPDRVVCDQRKCRDARYRRLHPEAYRAKVRRKSARRRARQKGQA